MCAIGAREAFEALNRLCKELQLDKSKFGAPAFDGLALLLLTPKKLEFWEVVGGHGRKGTHDMMDKIIASRGPLQMAYARKHASAGSYSCASVAGLADKVPDGLFYVERHDQHAQQLMEVLNWEVSSWYSATVAVVVTITSPPMQICRSNGVQSMHHAACMRRGSQGHWRLA